MVLLLPATFASAQSDTVWDRVYPVSAAPTLGLDVTDAGTAIHSCGGCRAVHVHVTVQGAKLSDYHLTESQNGNSVQFSLRERSHIGFRMNWHTAVQVDVEMPATANVNARSADGNLEVRGLHGAVALQTSDGNETLHDVSGELRLQSSDGRIAVEHSSGTVEARSSDGSMTIAGMFTALQLHASDGQITVELAEGSRLNAPSTIEGSDGSINVHLPHTFPAELDLRTSDGSIQSSLPLSMDGFNSKGDSGHAVHGKLDGGGAQLNIHTADGSIRLSRS